jgi:CubicO group peptidase (beta-lactamase class C family)
MTHSARKRPLLLCVLAIVFACGACGKPTPEAAPDLYWPTDGWRTCTPEQQGMDSQMLAQMMTRIDEQGYAIDAVAVVRNGYLVAEAYVNPFKKGDLHIIYSCTKSVVSALVGIAIDQGRLQGADQPILHIFPERAVANVDANKQAMALGDVLNMSTGLNCRDSYLYRWEGLDAMRATADWVQYVLDLPMREEPGTRFEYCNGASYLLSAIVQGATGMKAADFAHAHLFGPLGITRFEWAASPQGVNIGWSDLHLTPLDMAKFGYLYLNQGWWDGKQVVSSEWVKESTRSRIRAGTLSDGYGYQWWVDDAGYYMALGYSGQYIVVVPDKNMVVVFVSHLPENDFFLPEQLLTQYVLPAAKSSEPLPVNSRGVMALESSINALAKP